MTTTKNKTGNHIFDFRIDELKKVEYFIGIDSSKTEMNSYCLTRRIEDSIEIIMIKTIKDKDEFDSEVDNISKYFGAIKITETP